MRFDSADQEKTYAAEKHVALVRLAVLALNSVVYVFLLDKSGVITGYSDALLVLAWVYGLFVYFVRPYRRFPILLSSYFTTITDAVLITAWLHATGGFNSPYHLLWYVSIAAVAYRWKGRETMVAAAVYAASYVGMLLAMGDASGHWAQITLDVGYIFLLAVLGVLLSGEVIQQIRSKVEFQDLARQAAAAEAKFRGLLESAPDPMVIANRAGAIVLINREAETAFGYSRQELINQPLDLLVPGAFRESRSSPEEPLYLGGRNTDGSPVPRDLQGRRKDGSPFPVDIRLSPSVSNDDGMLVTAVIRDISERERAAEALQDSEERFRRLSEVTLEGLIIHDRGIILDLNPAYARMFGYSEEELRGMSVLQMVTPDSREAVISAMSAPISKPAQYVGLRKDGSTFPIEVIAREYRYQGRDVRVTTVRDVSGRVEAERAVRESEGRLRALIENASDFIIVLDKQGTIKYISPSVARMMGSDESEIIGKSGFGFVHPDDMTSVVEVFQRRLVEHGVGVPIEFRVQRFDGEWRILEAIGNFDQLDSPELEGVVLNARDITDRRQAEEEVRRIAYHDSLTSLPNRALFEDRLEIALAQARRSREMLAVVFMDIDHFKLVNDSLGHAGGDELLKMVSEDLTQLIRDGDTVARVGGDEFVLLLSGIQNQLETVEIAQRILSKFDKRRVIRGRELRLTTSIGISLFPGHGEDPDTLIANADIAMYQAKDRGRNGYQMYSPAMKEDVVERLALENDLRNALDGDEFVIHFQPIVDVAKGTVVAAESLIRWRHPGRGLVPPDEFIPFASEGGLIAAIDEWVLRNSCLQGRQWHDAGHELDIAVNLSARTLQRGDLVGLVRRTLDDTGLAPENLTLEITESSVMANIEAIAVSLKQLREMGVVVSVDDFGTGYSSLSYLKRFPIDTVKIDRSFIGDVTTDPNDAAIVSTIISMAHSMNLRVIAEGVEAEEQLQFLRDQGCDEFQGFYFARPLNVSDFDSMLGADRERAKTPAA